MTNHQKTDFSIFTAVAAAEIDLSEKYNKLPI